jgi:hypothetical protein
VAFICQLTSYRSSQRAIPATLWEFPLPPRHSWCASLLAISDDLVRCCSWDEGGTLELGAELRSYSKLLSAQASILVTFQVVAILRGQAATAVGILLLRAVLKRGICSLSSCPEDVSSVRNRDLRVTFPECLLAKCTLTRS